jgi:hypothetical protein
VITWQICVSFKGFGLVGFKATQQAGKEIEI